MAEVSAFRGVVQFLADIGIYDIVLPFLLIFTIVYAIFERTKVLGTEKVGDTVYSKKNINALVAFVIAFLVVASSQLVSIINEAMANIVILLLLSVTFLLLIGTFFKEGEDVFLKEGGWRTTFMFLMFIGIVLIFLNAVKTNGQSWLMKIFLFFQSNWDSKAVWSVVLVIIIILVMLYIVSEKKAKEAK